MKRKRPIKSQSLETQAYVRQRVMELHKQNRHPTVIAEALSLGLRTVYRWIAEFAVKGADMFVLRKHPGPGGRFSEDQLLELSRIILDTSPSQYCFEFKLWTLRRVQVVIEHEFKMKFSIQWISVLLRRIGLSPQRPKLSSPKQDAVWVERWRSKDFPELKARAAKENAQIWFADEASFRAGEPVARTWGAVGKTPELKAGVSYGGINVISAITGNGELEFMAVKQTINSEVFQSFLSKLLVGRTQKITLVLDNCRVHNCKKTMEFVERHKEMLEIVFIPPYSPDLNPTELVWAQAKKVTRSSVFCNIETFRANVEDTMNQVKKMAGKIQSFYRHCTVFAVP